MAILLPHSPIHDNDAFVDFFDSSNFTAVGNGITDLKISRRT